MGRFRAGGGVLLQLFIAMSRMSVNLLSRGDSPLSLVVTMALHVILASFFATQIVFRMMGRDYDAAMVVGGFFGLELGATPGDIASMDAVSKEDGP